jgi:hypothetical protein
VAAGVDEFGRRLGPWAEGLLGLSRWWCHDGPVVVGPTGPQFVCVGQASALVIIADAMIKRVLGRPPIR